jgi:biotin carboxyl carrier protein
VVEELGARPSTRSGRPEPVEGRNPEQSQERLTVTALGNGRFRVFDGQRQRLAYAAGPPAARWVFLDGRVYVIDTTPSMDGLQERVLHDEMALASPMPAIVATISIKPGQDVSQGDLLIMLEAMKMELPIKAPRDGRVKVVGCRVGDLVQPGVALVELE